MTDTFRFRSMNDEVIRLDSDGFHYRGQFIADAGEAHRLMVDFLKQNTHPQPEPEFTPEEIEMIQAPWSYLTLTETTGNKAMTDWKALCAELLEALENAVRVVYHEDGTKHISTADPVITKADAALSKPERGQPFNQTDFNYQCYVEDCK